MSLLLADFRADVRHALRTLRKTPGLTAVTILTLALGLGATTAIYSVVNAVLLKPLPYANPERVVQIVENVPAEETFAGIAQRRASVRVDELASWRAAESFAGVAVVIQEGRTLTKDDSTVQLYGARVSPALFAIRGVPPLLGRGLLPDEERPDADAIVLGEATWREHFAADPNIVGRTLRLDGRAHTVVGVMPPEFGADAFWTPFFPAVQPGQMIMLGGSALLRDGVSLEAASAEINSLGLGMRGLTPEEGAAPRFELVRELDQVTQRVVPALRVLVVAVVAVLLIVCTNVANLLLVRGTQRQQEIAVRRSLGATRGRIVRLVLAESLTLAAFAGVVGVALAFVGVRLLKSAAIIDLPRRFVAGTAILPRAEDIAVDPSVLAFVGVLVVVTGALFGVLPALRLSRFGERGHNAAAQLSAAASNTRVGHVLATVQLGCAMTLLIGAALLLNSFLRLASIDTGFDPRGVLGFELVVPGNTTAERKLEVADRLAARLQDHPGVEAAGFIDIPVLSQGNIIMFAGGFVPEGMSDAEWQAVENPLPFPQRTQIRNASSAYLRTIGARLVEGEWLDDPPNRAALQVVVTRPFAERYLAGRSPIGVTLRNQFGVATIVGVVDDIHIGNLESAPESALFFEPGALFAAQNARQPQRPSPMNNFFLTNGGSSIAFVARTAGDPLAIATDLRAIVRDIDPTLAVDSIMPMEGLLSGVTTRPRFYASLLGAFAALAGFIAVIGIYGVLAYLVSQRTKEIGIRIALGAQQRNVLKLVLGRGVTMIAIGVTAGVLGALGLTRYLEGMLYGVRTVDAATYVVVAAAFAAAALLASYVPARRAARVDPLVALRYE